MKRLLTAIPLATFAGATLFGGLLASMGTASADQNYDHRNDHQQVNRRDDNHNDYRRDDNHNNYWRNDAYRNDDHRDYRQAEQRRWVAAHWEDRGYDRVYVPGSWIDVNLSF
jgi:hypothetical protein